MHRNREIEQLLSSTRRRMIENLAVNHFYSLHLNPEQEPLVSSVQVSADESVYHVRAKFPSRAYYDCARDLLGQTLYFELEGDVLGNNRYSICLESMDKRLVLFFIKELIRISPGLVISGLIQDLSAKGLSLTQAYTSITDIPHWHKCIKSDRHHHQHIFTYKNTSRHAKVREIKIIESDTSAALNILFKFNSDEHYRALASNLVASNLIERETAPFIRNTILVSGDKNNAASLARIHAIFQQVRSFEHLLIDSIFREMAQIIRMPIEVTGENMMWTRNGDWEHLTTNSVWGFMRQVNFENSRVTSPVKKIFLSEYTNGDFNITLSVRDEHYQQYMTTLVAALEMPQPSGSDRLCHYICRRAHGSESALLSSFLMMAYALDPDIEIIFGEIIRIINAAIQNRPVTQERPRVETNLANVVNNINPVRTHVPQSNRGSGIALTRIIGELREILRQSFEEHYDHTSASYRPSVSTASPVNSDNRPLGKNADLIADLDLDVPKEFECALSGYIMSDPVYFNGLPSKNIQGFERSWITKHLEQNSTHPITREKVSKDMLIENKPLQVATSDFVTKKVRAHSKCK